MVFKDIIKSILKTIKTLIIVRLREKIHFKTAKTNLLIKKFKYFETEIKLLMLLLICESDFVLEKPSLNIIKTSL